MQKLHPGVQTVAPGGCKQLHPHYVVPALSNNSLSGASQNQLRDEEKVSAHILQRGLKLDMATAMQAQGLRSDLCSDQIAACFDSFKSHHLSRGTLFHDWREGFYGWVKRERLTTQAAKGATQIDKQLQSVDWEAQSLGGGA